MKKLMAKIGAWIQGVFDAAFQKMKTHSLIAVNITQGLKKIVVDNPMVLDLATAIIPGDLDDTLVKKLRPIIQRVAHETLIAHNILDATSNPTDALAELVKYLQSLPYNGQVDWYITITARFAQAISDGKLTMAELAGITQAIYFKVYIEPKLAA